MPCVLACFACQCLCVSESSTRAQRRLDAEGPSAVLLLLLLPSVLRFDFSPVDIVCLATGLEDSMHSLSFVVPCLVETSSNIHVKLLTSWSVTENALCRECLGHSMGLQNLVRMSHGLRDLTIDCIFNYLQLLHSGHLGGFHSAFLFANFAVDCMVRDLAKKEHVAALVSS